MNRAALYNRIIARPVVAAIVGYAFAVVVIETVREERKRRDVAKLERLWNVAAVERRERTETALHLNGEADA